MGDQEDGRVPVVGGRSVRREKVERARQLRRNMTSAERILWQAVRDRRLARLHIRRQQVISGFIVDFYCHAARVVIELDGAVHRGAEDYDAARDAILAAQGLLILRFTNQQVVAARDSVLAQIASACAPRLPPRDDGE
ncbi:MAG TPA: DUF559 domain-containing protein [Ktedonobacterales bacterium]